MWRSHRYLTLFAGLLGLPLIWGCAATPLQTDRSAVEVDFSRYTIVVVKNFQNGVGDDLPPRLLREVPEAVIASLHECYPKAFAKIARTPSGSPEELVVGGTITEYREKIWYDLYDRVKVTSQVTFVDGQSGRELTKITVDPVGKAALANPIAWSLLAVHAVTGVPVGILAPSLSEKIDVVIDKAASQIADAIAEKRGIVKRQEAAMSLEPESGEQDSRTRTCH